MKSRFSRGLMISALAGVVALAGQAPALAVVQPGGQLVREAPAPGTPHVLDGMVYSVTRVGGEVVLGGKFTRARNDGSDTDEAA